MKEKKQEIPKSPQLKFEFGSQVKHEAPIQFTQIETGKVISLSGSNLIEKTKIDYSKIILNNTKSF